MADSVARGRRGKADGEDEELYRLAGKVVCVEQEVANKVEMCVASKRDEGDRAIRDVPDDGVEGGAKPAAPFPGQGGRDPAGVPDSNASTGEKVRYLKYHWREMRERWRLGVSEEQFASYVMGSDGNRNIVAHSTIVHNDGTLTNVHEGTDIGVADLERFLVHAYRARNSIDRLCEYMGLDDYAGYVRQRKEEGKRGRRAARSPDGKGDGPATRGAGRPTAA